MTDWSDETLRPLDELARIAFPEGSGVTADTLKRRARKGQLRVYRPGKQFLSSLADVRGMIEATRVKPRQTVNSTSLDRSNQAFDLALQQLDERIKEKKRLDRQERERRGFRTRS